MQSQHSARFTISNTLLATGAILLGGSAAFAAPVAPGTQPDASTYGNAVFTGRNFVDTARTGEKTHGEILNLLYGGNFVHTGPTGLDYTNGDFYIQRIPDRLTVGQQVEIGQAASSLYEYTDQVWSDRFERIEAHYRFAGYEQDFGYITENQPAIASISSSADYHKLLEVTWQHYGPNYEPIGITATMPDLEGADFYWGRNRINGLFSSKEDQNRDGLDHLLTYKVIPLTETFFDEGEEGPIDLTRNFLLFWEDQTQNDNVHSYDIGDWDYNDLVVEVQAQYNTVPEPAALSLIGLGGLALLRRRRQA